MFHKLLEDGNKSEHGVTERPWGTFVVLDTVRDSEGVIHKQKLLIIKPNTAIRLHKHINYSELWIGETEFDYIVEDDKGILNQSTAEAFQRVFIPKNKKHMIISKAKELKVFELQTGLIVDEDNIKFD